MKIDELQERLQEVNEKAQELRATAEAEKRDLSAEERRDLDSLMVEFDTIQGDIEREQKLAQQTEALSKSQGRKTAPNIPTANKTLTANGDDDEQVVTVTTDRRSLAPRVPAEPRRKDGGFRTLGDFAQSVRHASLRGGGVDPRLQQLAAATIYGNEASGADGGFAVPPDFRTAIMQKVMGEESLLPRTDQITVSGNSFTFPKDETTPWQTSGGILAYWGGEAGTKTQSKPALEQSTVRLDKVYALVPVSDELLEDAAGLDSYLNRKAPEKIAFKINLAIVQGNGVGQPLGILNAPSTVSVAKEGSQVADTLVGANVIKMYSRLYGPLRSGVVWLYNQDLEPQLFQLTLPGRDNTGAVVTGWGSHVYLPPNGLVNSPFGTLLGRPAIPTQACETLGDKGDIILVNLQQYLSVMKTGGIRTDISIHLWFDQDLTAYRFVMRLGGMPWWASSIAARDGSATYSWAVTLDERG